MARRPMGRLRRQMRRELRKFGIGSPLSGAEKAASQAKMKRITANETRKRKRRKARKR